MPPYDCITDFIFVETEIDRSDVILVPGGSHPQLMEKATALYRGGYAPYILPSGGANPKLPGYESEWQYLREIALNLGVPEGAILKEDKARNTFENAEFSLKILHSLRIPVDSAILVCKAHHARRALLTYQSVFPDSIVFFVAPVIDERGIARDTWFLDEDKIHIVMGEVVKIGQYFEDKIPEWVRSGL
jgi:uncharacterized SAM-binding protein YcdF (DUF218 family)